MSKREVEIEVQVKAVTAKAILVTHDGETATWVPKSMITDYAGSEELDAKVTSIFLSESFATEKGLL